MSLRDWWHRFRAGRADRRIEREVDEEIRFHLEQRTRENVERGLPESEAREEALRRFGNRHEVVTQGRAIRGARVERGRTLAGVGLDLRQSLQSLRRSPALTAAIVATLGLGLGATSAIFTLVFGVAVRPLPYPDAERLVWLGQTAPGINFPTLGLSPGLFAAYATRAASLEATGFYSTRGLTLTGAGDPVRLSGAEVDSGLLQMLGATLLHGRLLNAEDDREGSTRVVLLNESLWRDRFSASAGIVGQTVILDGDPFVVAGVVVDGFKFPSPNTRFWIDSEFRTDIDGFGRFGGFDGIARVRPEMNLEAITEDLDATIAWLLERTEPAERDMLQGAQLAAQPVPLQTRVVGPIARTLWILFSAVGFVLLIALVNVANLIAVRTQSRQSEPGHAGLRAPATTSNPTNERLAERRPRLDLQQGSSADSAVVVGCAGRTRTRFLVGSGLMARSFWALRSVDPGVEIAGLLRLSISLPESRYPGTDQSVAFHDELLAGLRALPGVTDVAAASNIPLEGVTGGIFLFEEGVEMAEDAMPTVINWVRGSRDFVQTLQVPLLAGRPFEDGDRGLARAPLVVNRALADLYWPGAEAVGRRVRTSRSSEDEPIWYEVVGVVENYAFQLASTGPAQPLVIFPLVGGDPTTPRSLTYVVRTDREPSLLADAVRATVWEMDTLPLVGLGTMRDVADRAAAPMAFTMTLLWIASTMALTLGCIGVYGVFGQVVRERAPEIGVRLALGANGTTVYRMLMRQGLLVGTLGIAAGLVASWALVGFMQSLLFRVSALDPVVHIAMAVGLLAIVSLATYVPARRAARIDPIEALRSE
ncbi:MAG: FtsX-like permease family protein [Acidobacteria bacterium]|nr:FtsX-like permease family protein [Acidobacteriota bacterium]